MGKVVIPGFRKIEVSGSGQGGTTNYEDLTHKPSINNVPLVGNLKTVDLKLTDATLTEEGVPAEAKTVGTKLEEQSTSLTAVKEELTKKVNVSDVPTKVSELQNDSNYQTDTDVTNTLTTYATKTYVGEQISSVDHLKREIVTEIPSPETADKNTIYMLKIESATGDDKYKEYLLIDGTLQCVGDTSVDLTDYAKKTEIPTELPANGGNSTTVNGHAVKSDVPENAVFTDTVYDDTEVKESVDEINSNLDGLEYGEVAGGKNILDITQNYKRYSNGILSVSGNKVTITGQWYCYYIIDVEENTDYFISFNIDSSTKNADCAVYNEDVSTQIKNNVVNKSFNSGNNTRIAVLFYSGTYDNGTTVYSNIQIEKGTKATPYEPYIPSVKMLANEITNIKNDLTKKTENKILAKGSEWTGTLESLGSNIDVSVMINGGNATDRPSGASLYGYYSSKTLNGGGSYCQYLDFANKKYYVKMWIGSSNNDTGWIALN